MKHPDFDAREGARIHQGSGAKRVADQIRVGDVVGLSYCGGAVRVAVTRAAGGDQFEGVVVGVTDANNDLSQSLGDPPLIDGDAIAFEGRHVHVLRHHR